MVFKPKRYQWKDGYGYSVAADVVGEVVEKIEARDGVITREAFLDESRSEDSPTHSMFTWDDTIAAEKWRLAESRKIITSLTIICNTPNDEGLKVPAIINITTEKKATYRNIVVALSDEESREIIVERLRREVEQLVERNRHITELAEILSDALKSLEVC